jgi:transcriptional regulator with XRE-family HTH domain
VLRNEEHADRYRDLLVTLKTARLQAGLSQSEVAERLSKPQSYISKCESGERRIDVIELLELASIYGKPLSFFLGQ